MKKNDIVKLVVNIPELNLKVNNIGRIVNLFDDGLCLVEIFNHQIYLLTINQVKTELIWDESRSIYIKVR